MKQILETSSLSKLVGGVAQYTTLTVAYLLDLWLE